MTCYKSVEARQQPARLSGQTILVPLDGSPFGEHALPVALAIARRSGIGITLAHAHHYLPPFSTPLGVEFIDPGFDTELRAGEAGYLCAVARRLRAVWDGPVAEALLEAPVAEALRRHAAERGAGLIVLSSHGRGGLARAWLGSVADELIRHSPVPTLVVHPLAAAPILTREAPLDRLLFPLDGSQAAERAIDMALAVGQGAAVRLLHVVAPEPRGPSAEGVRPAVNVEAEAAAWQHATRYLDAVAGRLRGRGVGVSTEVRIGQPAPEILAAAAACRADLIAMTTHGRSGLPRQLIGSVADKVLRGASQPLLVQRPQQAGAGGQADSAA